MEQSVVKLGKGSTDSGRLTPYRPSCRVPTCGGIGTCSYPCSKPRCTYDVPCRRCIEVIVLLDVINTEFRIEAVQVVRAPGATCQIAHLDQISAYSFFRHFCTSSFSQDWSTSSGSFAGGSLTCPAVTPYRRSFMARASPFLQASPSSTTATGLLASSRIWN